jgi:hypothetical protein
MLGKACNLGASKNLHFALSCSLLALLVDSAEFIYRVQGAQMLLSVCLFKLFEAELHVDDLSLPKNDSTWHDVSSLIMAKVT